MCSNIHSVPVLFKVALVFLLFIAMPWAGYAQTDASSRDTALNSPDSSLFLFKSIPNIPSAAGRSIVLLRFDSSLERKPGFSLPTSQSLKDNAPISPWTLNKKPSFLTMQSGYIGYNFSYRSGADTPFLAKDLTQHQLMSSLRITVADKLPLIVNAYLRRSNSSLFPAIDDVQVSFDAAAYRERLSASFKESLLKDEQASKDSLLRKLHELSQNKNLRGWLFNPLNMHKLVDAHEIINVPEKSYDMSMPDSINKKRADSLQQQARKFIALYTRTMKMYDSLLATADSLKRVYQGALQKDRQFEQLVKGQFPSLGEYNHWKSTVDGSSAGAINIPQKDKWLLGIRSAGIWRNNLNYSDLTVSNLSVTGVNAEYNSWYYAAAAAGWIDYRFTDFLVSPVHKSKQFLYLGRLGLGRLEKNYFIVTGFRGQKQLFAGTTSGSQMASVTLTGLSAQAKWQVGPNTYIIGEVAQSFSPNLIVNSDPAKNPWSFSDKSNKAFSLKFYSYFPSTATRFEGSYKFTGADFQSFNSFQTNAQLKSWYAKAEQSFLKKKLKLIVSLRTSDFSNPYVLLNYNASTVFKSVSLSYRQKGWPTVSIGYMPMTQLTMLGTQLVQNQFQTLNASVSHFYMIGSQRVSTSLVYTKFYNSSSDSGLIYYNSINIFLAHTLFFNRVTGNITISHSQNPNYRYDVMDENFSFQIVKQVSAGGGVKINNLNHAETKLGEYLNASVRTSARDVLTVYAENGFLPGNGESLVKNMLGNVSFTKTIK